jgi:hypothetical protein
MACMAQPIPTYLLIGVGLVALQALLLLAMGQPSICECGYIKFWHGNVASTENSQHLTDWYTFSHVIHGVLFYLLLWLIAPTASIGLRFAFAIGLEAGWEVFENTPFIIERYRRTAMAQGYFGDSTINSVADTFAAALGFLLARRLSIWASAALVIALELFVGFMIRDNLLLNVIQLVYPIEALSRWQMGT